MSDNNSVIDSMKLLEGKTIAKVHVHGVNCATIETDKEEFFMVESIRVCGMLPVYGIEVTQMSKDKIISELGTNALDE